MKVDDPVGAISVHGTNGLWGVLSVGLFADGTATTEEAGTVSPARSPACSMEMPASLQLN